jgi:hypothetical protein
LEYKLVFTFELTSEHERISKCPPASRGARAQYKMQDQRNYGEYEQQMNHSARYVEYRKAAQPSDQQNDE